MRNINSTLIRNLAVISLLHLVLLVPAYAGEESSGVAENELAVLNTASEGAPETVTTNPQVPILFNEEPMFQVVFAACAKQLDDDGVGSTCSCSASGPGASCSCTGTGNQTVCTCEDSTSTTTCKFSRDGTQCSCVSV